MLEGDTAAAIDDYRIVRRLGDAPSGSTFIAHDRLLDRAVLVRFVPEDRLAANQILAAARAFARVSHPALCAIHRVREVARRPYIVSSYARGVPLGTLAFPLPARRIQDIGRALASALATLHAEGVAHGGVSLDRIIVGPDGSVHLVGLGQARPGADREAL